MVSIAAIGKDRLKNIIRDNILRPLIRSAIEAEVIRTAVYEAITLEDGVARIGEQVIAGFEDALEATDEYGDRRKEPEANDAG